MTKHGTTRGTTRGTSRGWVRLAASFAVGAGMFQLGSCDPAVRATLLTGLEQTTGTLLNTANAAFFISLQDDDDDAGADPLTTT